MAPFVTPVELQAALDALEQRQGTLIRQLQGALGGRRLVGPFVANSGNIAPGAYAFNVVVVHDLGTTDYYVLAEQVDSGWGMDVTWAVVAKGANDVTFSFRADGSAHNPSALRLNFFLSAK